MGLVEILHLTQAELGWGILETRAKATEKTNAGILRCAQNDKRAWGKSFVT
jgi:hypothetical protein